MSSERLGAQLPDTSTLEDSKIQSARMAKRFSEFRRYNFGVQTTDDEYMKASEAIERRIRISPADEALKILGGTLHREHILLQEEYYGLLHSSHDFFRKQTIQERLTTIKSELESIWKKRATVFINSNPELFHGLPETLITPDMGTREAPLEGIAQLLALPYHLQRMRSMGCTHIVASATSSVPYCIIFKKIDELMYPDKPRIKFLLFSTKTQGQGESKQNEKIISYFAEKADANIGAFDECASSNPISRYNTRKTVSEVARRLKTLLGKDVVGNFGTDTMHPTFNPGNEVSVGTRSHGDEGKFDYLSRMILLLNDEQRLEDGPGASWKARFKLWEKISGQYVFREDAQGSFHTYEFPADSKGYERKAHGKEGLAIIHALEKLACIAFENFKRCPDSIWNPFNDTIRRAVDKGALGRAD